MNARHRRTLEKIFTSPTLASIKFSEIELLIKALGGTVREGRGSRVRIEIKSQQLYCHRPHPGKEAKRYQVEELRNLMQAIGVKP